MMQNRLFYIDLLKVFALFCIILTHVGGEYMSTFEIDKMDNWSIANIYNSIGRVGVPLFFMITGALLLSKNLVLNKNFFNKVLSRLVIPLVIWTLIYITYKKIFLDIDINVLKHIVSSIIRPESGHLWFMYTMIGIYLLLPLIKNIQYYSYFLGIWFISVSMIPFLYLLQNAHNIQSKRNAIAYIGLPILGYLLSKVKYSKIIMFISILTTIGSLIFITTLTNNLSLEFGKYIKYYHYNINTLILLYATSVFIIFKFLFEKITFKDSVFTNLIIFISKYSLGIYLIHIMILYFVKNFIVSNIDLWLLIPLETLLTFLISGIFIMLMSKNSILNKII